MILGSCKPIARNQQTLTSDSEKLEVKFLHTGSGAVKLMGCLSGECHNLLKNKKGDDPYEFFKLDAVLTDLEESKGKLTGLRKKVLVGVVTVGVGVALAFGIRASALRKQIKYIDDLKGDMLKYAEAGVAGDFSKQDEYAEKLIGIEDYVGNIADSVENGFSTRSAKRVFREDNKDFEELWGIKTGEATEDEIIEFKRLTDFAENFPNFSKRDTQKLLKALSQINAEENVMAGVSGLEELFLAKGKSVQFAHGVIVGTLAAIPAVSAGYFGQEMRDNKKLKAQSRNIVTLFSERTTITLSNDELKQLLKVLSKYLPAEIDKNGLKHLS